MGMSMRLANQARPATWGDRIGSCVAMVTPERAQIISSGSASIPGILMTGDLGLAEEALPLCAWSAGQQLPSHPSGIDRPLRPVHF